jgi:RNA polymerase sigma-70 factor, ECF subfamily
VAGGADSGVRSQYRLIYRYLFHRTGDSDRAADLTQETFASAARALASADTKEPLGLLYRTAQRRFIDELRRRRANPIVVQLDDVELEALPAGYGREIVAALRRALGTLSDDHRDVVVWKLFEDRSFAEIARRAGVSEDACKMRFSRALRALRAELEKEGIRP